MHPILFLAHHMSILLAAAVVFFGCLPIQKKGSFQSSWALRNLHILSKANLLGHRGQLLSGIQIPLPDVGPIQVITFDLWGILSSSWGKSCRCRKERLCNGWPQMQQKHVSGLWRACRTSGSTTCFWARCAPSLVRALPQVAVTIVVPKPAPSSSAHLSYLHEKVLPCNAKRPAPSRAITNSGSTCVWPAKIQLSYKWPSLFIVDLIKRPNKTKAVQIWFGTH